MTMADLGLAVDNVAHELKLGAAREGPVEAEQLKEHAACRNQHRQPATN